MVKKRIILGIGILIILLALAGTVSARNVFGGDCTRCHIDYAPPTLTAFGSLFLENHKFDGVGRPNSALSCTKCHVDPNNLAVGDYTFTANGSSYDESHRYNTSTLATKLLPSGCGSCHADVVGGDFSLLKTTPTYLGSSVCQDCHKAKYEKWSNTLHAVMLTPKAKAQAMDLPLPAGKTWDDIGFVRVGKTTLAYVNTTGYFLTGNYAYNTKNKNFSTDKRAGVAYGTCAECHTTGWNGKAVNTEYPGIAGTFTETGIACERCHGAAGNGHQVKVNYSAQLCIDCHKDNHDTGWENSAHAPPAAREGASCAQCHSPFDKYKTNGSTLRNATSNPNVACGVCHDIHDMTNAQYADTFTGGNFDANVWSNNAKAKLSFFNGTASLAAGEDVFDDLEAEATADIPASGVLCAKCHIPRHGLTHTKVPFTNLSHGSEGRRATCIDCHMEGVSASVGKDMMNNHENSVVSGKSCGGIGGTGANCHGGKASIGTGSASMTMRFDEVRASAHNVKEVGVGGDYNHFYGVINETTGGSDAKQQPNCNRCHDPMNWNPNNDYNANGSGLRPAVALSTSFKGVTCTVCHPLHDMGAWFAATEAQFGVEKRFGMFMKNTGYKMMETTTELCASCHANVRIGSDAPSRGKSPSSRNDNTGFNTPHGFPAADIFVGSWKQTGMLEFECTTCHMVSNSSAGTRGHTFKVNATRLQVYGRQGSNTIGYTYCSSCHITGSKLGNMSTTIDIVQEDTEAKLTTTKAKVLSAFATVKNSTLEKNLSMDKLAQAYFNVKLVEADESKGVHNPVKVDQLLDEAIVLADAANASLGQVGTSTVQLYAGWNLVSISETPASTSPVSVMSSVKSNLTIVWGLNASTQTWLVYDPGMNVGLNTLTKMVKGESYEIKVTNNCVWTV